MKASSSTDKLIRLTAVALALVLEACSSAPASSPAVSAPPATVASAPPSSVASAGRSAPPSMAVIEPSPIDPGQVEPDQALSLIWKGVDPAKRSWTSQLALDSAGRIWVGAIEQHAFWLFDRDGKLLDTWDLGTKADPNGRFGGIAFGPDGTIYIADAAKRKILVFDKDRQPLREWGTFGTGPGNLAGPNKIATDGHGNVYVHDDELEVVKEFTPDGTFVKSFAQGSYPSMYVDPDGHVYAVIGPDKLLKEFAPDGTVVRSIDVSKHTNFPIGIFIDSNKNIWLGSNVDHSGGSDPDRLLEMDASGKLIHDWPGVAVDELLVDPRGDRIYVSFIGQEYLAAYRIASN